MDDKRTIRPTEQWWLDDGLKSVGEWSRVKEAETEINILYVYINININYNYSSANGNGNKTLDQLKFNF